MRCEIARRGLSAALDGVELAAPVLAHVEGCGGCQTFRRQIGALRVASSVDLPSPPALPLLPLRPRRRATPLWGAAGVAAGLAMGVVMTMIGPDPAPPSPQVVAGLVETLAETSYRLEPQTRRLEIVESGWHPMVRERRFEGWLTWDGPGRASLAIDDLTAYPDESWVPNDVAVTVDGDAMMVTAVTACPVDLMPGCMRPPGGSSRVDGVPFDPGWFDPGPLWAPLWSLADRDPEPLPPAAAPVVGARGVRISVARARPLLDVLLAHGNWRPLYPADHVDLWFVSDRLVLVEVRPADDMTRRAWAAGLRFESEPELILSIALDDAEHVPTAPEPGSGPAALPDHPVGDMQPWWRVTRNGVEIEVWTEGSAWLRRDRHHGEPPVTGTIEVDLPSGVGYFDPLGRRLVVAGEDGWSEYRGSMGLSRLAAMVGETGRRLSPGSALNPDLLRLPPPSGVWVEDETTIQVGWDETGYTLVARHGDRLPPPVDPLTVGVRLRGTTGRYSVEAGRLEWVEDGRIYTLEAPGLTVDSLVALAGSLNR